MVGLSVSDWLMEQGAIVWDPKFKMDSWLKKAEGVDLVLSFAFALLLSSFFYLCFRSDPIPSVIHFLFINKTPPPFFLVCNFEFVVKLMHWN